MGSTLLPACGVESGIWQVTWTTLGASTRADCDQAPSEVTSSSLDQMADIGADCPPTCFCDEDRAIEPTCTSARSVVCDDGSGTTIGVSRVANDEATGFFEVAFTDGSRCAYEIVVERI